MNIHAQPTDRPLLDAALDVARAIGLTAELVQEAPALGRTRADALVRLAYGAHEALYAVEVKRAVRPATLGGVLHQLERLTAAVSRPRRWCTTPMSLDFSATPELRGLARVVRALQVVAAPLGVEFFLMGNRG